MSGSMIHMRILRKCGELEHAIKCRRVEPFSTEDYINLMEDISSRKRIGKTWTRKPMELEMVPKIFREDKRTERPVLKYHKCGNTSHLAKTFTKNTKINKFQIIEEVQCAEEKVKYGQDPAISEGTLVEDYPIESITAFFEVTKVHTHLPQSSEDCYSLINIQEARMCKTKASKGKGYTSGESCITSILMNDVESRVKLYTGVFCTCVVKYYLQDLLPECKNHLLPIEDVQLSTNSNNIYYLGILNTNPVFPHPAGSLIMKTEIVVLENSTSQHIILENYYLNIYAIEINNNKDRYFTIGENIRQKFSFSNMTKQISVLSPNKDIYRDEFVTDHLFEAQINPSLRFILRHEYIDVFDTYKNAFASDNEPLGAIRGQEVDITLSIDRPYPPVLIRPA
ncbi:hypothetical protein O181_004599 [Austropuccinia psidii MF-1]|uniref:Uncharacterized protein n=1 Tax=Austropuccinia psidii MF-1 TaxID=1389203 RepID=A0A9Q3BGI3_9BASI|nr:hypothetical protein [Austropuccinia psidii MF-1]